VRDGETVQFVDTAPLAAIREAITFGTPATSPKTALDPHAHTFLVGRRATHLPGS